MAITVINKPSNRFTIVSNTIVRDKRLSCGAKGVALIILHFPEDIVPTLDLLRYISPSDGRDKLRGYLQELEECKYLKRDTKRGTNGKFEGAEWTFDSDPTPVEPSTGEPEPGNPTSAETTIDNTNLSNTSGAKTRKDNTLDASASSAALGFMHPINPLGDGGDAKCNNCGYIEPVKHGTSWYYPPKCPRCNGPKVQIKKTAKAHPNTIDDIKSLIIEQATSKQSIPDDSYIPQLDTSNMTVEFVEMKKDKIPYKEISDYFLKKHREFRKVKDDKYMPKWGAKETKAVKRLIEAMNEANLSKSEYRELTPDRIMRSFQFMTEAFILYLKDCKDSNYARTTPILPSQLTESVFNRILPYIQKLETVPKLEIKQYENKGIAIGPMPEGW